jgi:hypothetical protein
MSRIDGIFDHGFLNGAALLYGEYAHAVPIDNRMAVPRHDRADRALNRPATPFSAVVAADEALARHGGPQNGLVTILGLSGRKDIHLSMLNLKPCALLPI